MLALKFPSCVSLLADLCLFYKCKYMKRIRGIVSPLVEMQPFQGRGISLIKQTKLVEGGAEYCVL